MACLKVKSSVSRITSCSRPQLPVRPVRLNVRANVTAGKDQQLGFEVGKALTLASTASSWLVAGNAQAAQELASIAASDNRVGLIATLFVPALGWVGYNMFQPFLNQMAAMQEETGVPVKKATKVVSKGKGATAKRSVAAAVGLGAAVMLMSSQTADASELMQLADSDGRAGLIFTLFVPALGWVAFNMFQPFLNQLAAMDAEKPAGTKGTSKKKRSVAGAVGLSTAALLMSSQAADASELMQLADSDGRAGLIFTLFVPALGWVAFNMFQPFLNQLAAMDSEKPAKAVSSKKKRGVAAAIGLSTAAVLMSSQTASAATELMQLADSDSRAGLIFTLFVPALGWVAFNMFQPFLNQLAAMDSEKGVPVKKAGTAKLSGKTAKK